MESAIALGFLVGIILGSIALIYSFVKGRFGLGVAAIVCCSLAGIILGLIGAAPTCGLFMYLASKPREATDPVSSN